MTLAEQQLIQSKLAKLDTDRLHGQTPHRLRQLEKQTGVPWEQAIEAMARSGYSWEDAAALVGVKARTLPQYTRKFGLKFPWLGNRSPIARAQQSRAMQGKNTVCTRKLDQYTAFGITDSLPNLVRRFAPPGLEYNCVQIRITRGTWDLERALVTPPRPRSENVAPRNPNAANNWKRPYDTARTHA